MENKRALVAFFSRAGENFFPGGMKYIEKGNTHIAAEILAGAFMSTGAIALAIFLMDTVLDIEKRIRARIFKRKTLRNIKK